MSQQKAERRREGRKRASSPRNVLPRVVYDLAILWRPDHDAMSDSTTADSVRVRESELVDVGVVVVLLDFGEGKVRELVSERIEGRRRRPSVRE